MLSWILQITTISIIFIFLVHHLIQFFKDTLTVPKIKDLVNSPAQKYQNMFQAMNQTPNDGDRDRDRYRNSSSFDENYKNSLLPPPPKSSTKLSQIDENEVLSMKNELKSYLKNQHLQTEYLQLGTSSIGDLNSSSFAASSNYDSAPFMKKKVKITELA